MLKRLQTFFKKLINWKKADIHAVVESMDVASAGMISLLQKSWFSVYQKNTETKFINLALDIVDNGVSEAEFQRYIGGASKKEREFIGAVVQKNLLADNRLTVFLLAKLWLQYMKNGELNYYESLLFTNINTIIIEDCSIFYLVMMDAEKLENGLLKYQTTEKNKHYKIAFSNLNNVGIIKLTTTVWAEEEKDIFFETTPYTDVFLPYLQEFFEKNQS